LRAVYGAFNAMKNRDGADKHKTAFLTWIAYIGGPRESRQLLGEVILSQDDVVAKKQFSDGSVPSTWSIDLHYPKKQYAIKFPENPFISIAIHDRRIDRAFGYPIPYRCFYSRNIDNLFMAGRCISVTHQTLGTVRVMKTCGMMGEVVGKAASICIVRDCFPHDVYDQYWNEMESLLVLPGKAYRKTATSEIIIPKDALKLAGPYGPASGLDPEKLAGLIIDDKDAIKTGKWTGGEGLKGYVGYGYLYAGANSKSTVEFKFTATKTGKHDIRVAYQSHENRGSRVPVTVTTTSETKTVRVNMKIAPKLKDGFSSLGTFALKKGETVSVLVSTADAGGTAHADAVQVLKAD